MAKRIIRFPLKMKNGTEVRTIEELRENFDIDSVLSYFTNGKLAIWLRDRYYDDLSKAVLQLSANSENIGAELCSILGVDYQEPSQSVSEIKREQEKLLRYRELLGDETYTSKISQIAIDQNDLDELVAKGIKEIYLFKGEFTIDLSKTDIEYIGIDNPKVEGNNMDISHPFPIKNIKNLNVIKMENKMIMIPENINDVYQLALRYKDVENDVTFILFKKAAESDHRDAMYSLAYCYEHGRGVDENKHIAAKWYKKAYDKGHPFANMDLARLANEDVSTAQRALDDIEYKKIIGTNKTVEPKKDMIVKNAVSPFESLKKYLKNNGGK